MLFWRHKEIFFDLFLLKRDVFPYINHIAEFHPPVPKKAFFFSISRMSAIKKKPSPGNLGNLVVFQLKIYSNVCILGHLAMVMSPSHESCKMTSNSLTSLVSKFQDLQKTATRSSKVLPVIFQLRPGHPAVRGQVGSLTD